MNRKKTPLSPSYLGLAWGKRAKPAKNGQRREGGREKTSVTFYGAPGGVPVVVLPHHHATEVEERRDELSCGAFVLRSQEETRRTSGATPAPKARKERSFHRSNGAKAPSSPALPMLCEPGWAATPPLLPQPPGPHALAAAKLRPDSATPHQHSHGATRAGGVGLAPWWWRRWQ